MGNCKIDNCNRLATRKSMCNAHYKRCKYGTDLLKPIQLKGQYEYCTVKDCNGKHRVKSFCEKHYQQFRVWGHVLSNEEKLAHYRANCPKGVSNNTGRTHFKKGCISLRKGITTGKPAWNRIGDGITAQSKLERDKFKKTMVDLVFARDNYTCVFCDQYSGHLHVDHIKAWANYPELRFELNNCRTLCRACHYYITFKRKLPLGSRWGLTTMARERG